MANGPIQFIYPRNCQDLNKELLKAFNRFIVGFLACPIGHLARCAGGFLGVVTTLQYDYPSEIIFNDDRKNLLSGELQKY